MNRLPIHRLLPHSVGGRVGALLLATILLVVVVGPWVTPYAPDEIHLPSRLQAPSADHWFGTDELGRDLFSRIAHGGRYSLFVAVLIVAVSGAFGAIIGAAVAVGPRWVNTVASQLLDIAMSVPALVLTMALAAALGPGLFNVALALVVARLPAFVLMARNQAQVVRRHAFVEAASLYGAGLLHQLRHHLLPNVSPALLVQAVSDVGGAILACAALGFIGLGAQPPTPEWGALVASGRLYFLDCWWYAVFPGLSIAVAATGFNLIGDETRDRLDPRLARAEPEVAP